MLRRVLLWLGALLMVGGILLSLTTRSGAGLGMCGIGGVLLLSLLVEKRRYQRVLDTPPGPEWEATGERFVEPATDVPIMVYCHRASGKRVYVRMQTLPPQ